MSTLMSAPRKALLDYLNVNHAMHSSEIARVTGISPRSIDNFAQALIDEELVARKAGNDIMPGGNGFVLGITDKGRAALAVAVVPEEIVSRKADDRSLKRGGIACRRRSKARSSRMH